MPIHDWTRVNSGTFHNFHQNWTIDIHRALNGGILPPGYFAMTDQRVDGPEPDVIALRSREPSSLDGSSPPGGLAIAEAPPRAALVSRGSTDRAAYARKANRISIRHPFGNVVAIIEVVSPGNKDSVNAMRSFASEAIDFLRAGIHLVVIDLFPPTARDPDGIHAFLWEEMTGKVPELPPADKPLTIASYESGAEIVAYVNPVAVGEALPDTALFFAPGRYVNIPLEETYASSWGYTPMQIREWVEAPPGTPGFPSPD